jgi:hypothetical protein
MMRMNKGWFFLILLIIVLVGFNWIDNGIIGKEDVRLQGSGLNYFEEVLNGNPNVNYKQNHPRLPGPDQAYLQRVLNNPGYYNSLKNTANNYDPWYLLPCVSFENPNPVFCPHYDNMMETLLAFKVSQLEGNPNQIYYQKVIDSVNGGPNGYAIQGSIGAKLRYASFVYDQLYYDMSSSEKQFLMDRIDQLLFEWINNHEVIVDSSLYNSFFNNRVKLSYLNGAIAIYPEHQNSVQHFQYAGNLMFNEWLPTVREVVKGGGWHEGWDYKDRFYEVAYSALSVVGSAFNVDLFAQEDYFEDLLYIPLFDILPTSRFVNRADTSHQVLFNWQRIPSYLGFAIAYNNPHAFWLYANGNLPYGIGQTNPYSNQIKPSLYYPWAPPWPETSPVMTDPRQEIPLQHYFEGIKQVSARSDFTENAVQVEFGIDPGYWSHSGLDSGRFSIYRQGSLAIDSGLYLTGAGAEFVRFYKEQALAHNVMLFYDPTDTSQNYNLGVWTSLTTTASLPYPNDGGYKRHRSGFYTPDIYDKNERDTRLDEFDFGSFESMELQNDYVYAKADLKPAYTPTFLPSQYAPSYPWPNGATERTDRLNSYYRTFLYIRPDIFIVLDKYDLKNQNIDPIWLLHSINQPQIQGNEVIITRDENVYCAATAQPNGCGWPGNLQNTNNGPTNQNNRYYQYDGKLKLTNLYPGSGVQIDPVGGPGQEYADISGPNHLSGVNHNLCGNSDPGVCGPAIQNQDPTFGIWESGSWRVQVTNPSNPSQDVLLNVMQAGTTGTNFLPVQQLSINSGNVVGTLIETENSENWAIVFGRDNFILGSFVYNLNSGNVKNLFTDLYPGLDYDVAVRDVTGNLISQQIYTANSEGTLRFDLNVVGNYEITVDAITETVLPEFLNLQASTGSLVIDFDTNEITSHRVIVTDLLTGNIISDVTDNANTLTHHEEFLNVQPSTTYLIDIIITDFFGNQNGIQGMYSTEFLTFNYDFAPAPTDIITINKGGNNGASTYSDFQIGTEGIWLNNLRVLGKYDLSSLPNNIPNMVANLVSSVIGISQSSVPASLLDISLHEIIEESTCYAANGAGSGISGSSSWYNYCHPGNSWANPGGDFATPAIDTKTIQANLGEPINFDVTAKVQERLGNGMTDFPFILKAPLDLGPKLDISQPHLIISGNTQGAIVTVECPLSSQFPNSVCSGARYNPAVGVLSCDGYYAQSAAFHPQLLGSNVGYPGVYEIGTETFLDGLDNDCDGLIDELSCTGNPLDCNSVGPVGSILSCNSGTSSWECVCPLGTQQQGNQCVSIQGAPSAPTNLIAGFS